eukprot:9002855-Pyramimonas_sp.AAC.1
MGRTRPPAWGYPSHAHSVPLLLHVSKLDEMLARKIQDGGVAIGRLGKYTRTEDEQSRPEYIIRYGT